MGNACAIKSNYKGSLQVAGAKSLRQGDADVNAEYLDCEQQTETQEGADNELSEQGKQIEVNLK